MRKDTFSELKKGKKIKDTWYGNGKVVSEPHRGKIKIELNCSGHMRGIHVYDRQHVNAFIVKR